MCDDGVKKVGGVWYNYSIGHNRNILIDEDGHKKKLYF